MTFFQGRDSLSQSFVPELLGFHLPRFEDPTSRAGLALPGLDKFVDEFKGPSVHHSNTLKLSSIDKTSYVFNITHWYNNIHAPIMLCFNSLSYFVGACDHLPTSFLLPIWTTNIFKFCFILNTATNLRRYLYPFSKKEKCQFDILLRL